MEIGRIRRMPVWKVRVCVRGGKRERERGGEGGSNPKTSILKDNWSTWTYPTTSPSYVHYRHISTNREEKEMV